MAAQKKAGFQSCDAMICFVIIKPRQDFIRHVQGNIWCHAYNWEPFQRYAVKSYGSAQLKLFYRWQQGGSCHYSCYSPLYSHTAAIIHNLWLSSEKRCNHGWKSISGTSGKIKKPAQCQQGQGLVQEKGFLFFFFSSSFPFSLCWE